MTISIELSDDGPDRETSLVLWALEALATTLEAAPLPSTDAIGHVRRNGQVRTLEAVHRRIVASIEEVFATERARIAADADRTAEEKRAARRREKLTARIREILDARR